RKRSRAELREEWVARELGAERRAGPVTRIDDRVGRIAFEQRSDGCEQRVPVPAWQIDAADGAGEEQVAAEERPVGVEGDVPGRVARHVDDLEAHAGDLD